MATRQVSDLRPTNGNASLLRACRAGDPEAWEQLVRRYQRLIYAIPRRAGLSDDEAAEVFQRVWLSLFEHLGQIEHPERLGNWLATTARRESLRQLRAERVALGRAVGQGEDDALAWLVDTALLPDEQLERLELQQLVRSCLASLDQRCRALLGALFYSDNPPSYTAIAAALGVAPGSIGPRRARCLRRLQQLIEEHEY